MTDNVDENSLIKKPKNIRLIPYYINYLTKLGLPIHVNLNNQDDCIRKINNLLHEKINPKDIKKAISDIEENAKNNILELDSFSWMNDEIACCYAWMIIRNTPALYLGAPEISGSLYYFFFPNKTPTTTLERKNLIINFFDYWNAEKERKISFLDQIKSSWAHIYSMKNPFSWLNKSDESMCNWVWDYLCLSKKIPVFDMPINHEEKYIFSYWNASIEAKKLLLINLNKAKNQQKFRDGIKTKKALNTYIDKNTKNNLDHLAKKHGKKINEMLEFLINKEFETTRQ